MFRSERSGIVSALDKGVKRNCFRGKMGEEKTGGREYYQRIKRAFGDDSDGRIAEALGTTRAAVSLWRTNKSVPDAKRLIRAAEVTGVRQEWFTTGEEQYFKHDDTLLPYSGPEHYRLAAVVDAEFKRLAEDEGVSLEELVTEIASSLGLPERNIYNYRSGKWSIPASIISRLSQRFHSITILKEMLDEHVEAAIRPLLEGIERQIQKPKGSKEKK